MSAQNATARPIEECLCEECCLFRDGHGEEWVEEILRLRGALEKTLFVAGNEATIDATLIKIQRIARAVLTPGPQP